jgi:predicted nucleotidyltransferase
MHVAARSQLANVRDPLIAATLEFVLAACERALPGRIRAGYLFGSHADGTAVAISDLDLFLVLRGSLASGATEQLRDIGRSCSTSRDVAVDIAVIGEEALLREGHFRIQAASLHVHGEDLRSEMPAISLAHYLRTYAEAPVAYMRILRQTDRLRCPVTYPDPRGDFFGYDSRVLPPNLRPVPNIKGMVSTVCWIATATVGLRGRLTARSKAEGVALYRQCVGDRWADFVAEIYELGKRRLGYLLPQRESERQQLRLLCRQMPAFENDYLAHYRRFLAIELGNGDEDVRAVARHRLHELSYAKSG